MASSSEEDVKDFVPNLLHEGHYKKWKSLMEDFLDRRGLNGFIDGTAVEKVRDEHDAMAWEKSDNFVQAWILATVSDDIRLRLRQSKTAEAMWIKLEDSYEVTSRQFDEAEEAGNIGQGKTVDLHKAVIDGEWEKAMHIIEEHPIPDTITKGITTLGETVLIVAVQSTSAGLDGFLEKLLPKLTPEDVKGVDFQGYTALHYAALLNNREAAKMLVQKNQDLPNYPNKDQLIPVQSAAWCGHREMVLYLMAVTREEILLGVDFAPTLFSHLISGELYDIASYLLGKKENLALTRMDPTPLAILAEKHSSFRSGISLRWWEHLIYWGVPTGSEGNDVTKLIDEARKQGGDTQNVAAANCCVSVRQRYLLLIQGVAKKLGVPTRSKGNNVAKLNEEAGKQGGDTQNIAAANCCVSVRQRLLLLIQGVAKKLGVPTRSEGNKIAEVIDEEAGTQGGDTQNVATTPSNVGVPTKSEGNNMAKPIEEARTQGGDTQTVVAANFCISVRQRLHLLIQGVAKKLEPYVPRIWGKKERQRRDNMYIWKKKERQKRDNIWKKKEREHHALELVKSLCKLVAKSNRSNAERIYKIVLSKAVRVGIPDEIVEEIAFSYPSALFFTNVDSVNFVKYAVMYRRERVFNLIHEVGAGWRCITGLDESNNNGLHLAARLGRRQQINLKASAAGAILHMQRELQWFQEVKSFTQPGEIDRRNSDDKTPEELFSDTQQDLVKEGEQWMKNTAGACTIVSALIVAMAFAAAITVPGGNNSTTGRPLLSEEKAFIIFGISDALALLSSITSSLMFLLILTSRYAEEDFLFTLPMRLIFGLITLFFSILSTMIAFSAILFLVFGSNEALILIPIVGLASIPAILFAALQFPLLIEMIQSTFGGGFFGKRRNRQHQD